MFWSIPHLQAAQRKISSVVPVKSPSIRDASVLTFGLSPATKNEGLTFRPVILLKGSFAGRFSGLGDARTKRAHCAPDGSLAPGGRVPN